MCPALHGAGTPQWCLSEVAQGPASFSINCGFAYTVNNAFAGVMFCGPNPVSSVFLAESSSPRKGSRKAPQGEGLRVLQLATVEAYRHHFDI